MNVACVTAGSARRWLILAACLAGAELLLAGEARAQIIHACFVPSSGTIYRIKFADPAETCKAPQHVEFQWNIQGPTGSAGADGVSGWELVEDESDIPPVGVGIAVAWCPVGKRVLGGGYFFLSDSFTEGRVATSSHPTASEGGLWGWRVVIAHTDDASHNPAFKAYAICATVATGP